MTQAPKRTCFVVGPIGDAGSPVRGHADWLLDEIITPVFSDHFKEFDVIRADRISSPGMIDSQIINHVLDDELVIADLTFQNANAFYELALRHMERKPIIHMFRAGEIIPFDVKPYRAIPFAFEHPKQRFEARDLLKQAIEAVLAKDFEVENPVTRARGIAELRKHAMPGMDIVLADIEGLKSQLQTVAQQAATALRAVSFSSNPPRSWLNRGAAQAAPTPGEFGAGFGYQGLANSETILGSGDFPSADALKALSEVSKKKT